MVKVFTPKNFRGAILLLLKLLIVIITIGGFMYVGFTYYPQSVFYLNGNYILAIVYCVILLSLAIAYGCFKIGISRMKDLVFSFGITVFLTNGISYLVLCLIGRDMFNIWPLVILTALQILAATILYVIANKIYFVLNPARKSLIVCSAKDHDIEVMKKFSNIPARYQISQILFEEEPIEKIKTAVLTHSAVILGQIDGGLRSQLIQYCFEKNKRLFIVPTPQDIVIQSADSTQIGDTITLMCKNRPLTVEQLALKRIVDLLFSSIGLILTSPIMLVVSLMIKLHDRGPVFYKQVRYTRNQETFNLIKFRSMVVDAEKDGAQYATENDNRITPIGRFIRATRIDELPQLLNILKGDMSIVGPRAERPEFADEIAKTIPEFNYRTRVKAGLTGYAQIYGKYNTSFEDKAMMDLYYIENYSFVLDLQLMFYTFKILFIKESTEGFETATPKAAEKSSKSQM